MESSEGSLLPTPQFTGRAVSAAGAAGSIGAAKQGIEIALYEKVGIGDGGVEGNNPFLHDNNSFFKTKSRALIPASRRISAREITPSEILSAALTQQSSTQLP